MAFRENRISGQYQFHGRVVSLRVDEVQIADGSHRRREVVEHPGGVCAVILTQDNEVLCVRQFRYARGEELLELPAGKLEPGESPADAVKREQREETGTVSERYIPLGMIYPTPAYDTEVIHLYACRVDAAVGRDLDDGELLSLEPVPLFRLEEMVYAGQIPDAKTQIGILRAAKLVREGRL